MKTLPFFSTFKHFNLFLIALVATTAQGADLFSLKTSTDKQRYVLGEPVRLKLLIEYLGAQALEASHPLDHQEYREEIEIVNMRDGSTWKFTTPEEAISERRDRVGRLPKLQFAPGGVQERNYVLLCWEQGFSPKGKTEFAFPDVGSYVIRAKIGYLEGVVTKEQTIIVDEPSETADKEAYQVLRRFGLLCALQHLPTLTALTNQLKLEVLKFQDVLTNYPTSVFSIYVRSIEQAASRVSVPLNVTPPEAEVVKATKELEAQWYDVIGFGKYYPDGNKAYVEKLLPLHDKLATGALTREEFDRIRAGLLKEYVTNYSRPLSPEEWRRRYEIYARETAERERQQQIDLQRYAIEADRILREKPKQQPK